MPELAELPVEEPILGDGPWQLLPTHVSGSGLAFGDALLRDAVARQAGPLLRMYRPEPTIAFGGSDRRNPGFEAAVETAVQHGFVPVIRAPGGHAVAYHCESVCIEIAAPSADPHINTRARFIEAGDALVATLARLGVDGGLGAVPGEYCKGDHSVHHAGRIKLIGTAQRIVRGGWMVGAGIVVDDAAAVRTVLTDVYRHLGLPFSPDSVGALSDIVPGVSCDDFKDAFLSEIDERFGVIAIPEPTRE